MVNDDAAPPAPKPSNALTPVVAKPRARASTDDPFGRRMIAAGAAIIVGFVGLFTLWARSAPIESAVIASGVVSFDSYRKTIQHLEGGIVERILVDDGDAVREGQTLIELSDVQPSTTLKRLEAQLLEARANEARLRAERDDLSDVTFPDDLASSDDPSVAAVLGAQRNLFLSRRKLFNERLQLLRQTIALSEEEITGLNGQIDASLTRSDLLAEELREVEQLFKEGLVPKPRLLALRGRVAEVEGGLSDLEAQIAQAQQRIVSARLEMGELRTAHETAVVDAYRAERASVFDLEQKVVSATDVLARTKVVSPIDGVVVDLQVRTLNGVVGPGDKLLDVVPTSDELVVEASVDPSDIDEVRAGMPAFIQLTSLSRRTRKPIEGQVDFVSADRLLDPETGGAYYQARVKLSPTSLGSQRVELQAGMGAEVFIRTGERTPLEYLAAPIFRMLNRGLRES
ncbi:MAG: HlyD family type I secretion periplasmic adaptor subunit [Parvularculaceae bacterium]